MEIEQVDQTEELDSSVAYPDPSPHLNTVIIFDWDDTLLSSTFLAARGYRIDNSMQRDAEIEAQLRLLERSVCSVLQTALRYGRVQIITNAENGWVHLSAQAFIPAVLPMLDMVTVISARSTYEPHYALPLQWKSAAFRDRLNECYGDAKCAKNVLSFGDSQVEREAVRTVTRDMSNTTTKSIKFAERPTMEQLRRQVELVTNCFHYLYAHQGDLDLMLTISPALNEKAPAEGVQESS